jgi:ABC-type Fe3+-hydroxamate transport system substrate-binding protein
MKSIVKYKNMLTTCLIGLFFSLNMNVAAAGNVDMSNSFVNNSGQSAFERNYKNPFDHKFGENPSQSPQRSIGLNNPTNTEILNGDPVGDVGWIIPALGLLYGLYIYRKRRTQRD